MMKKEMKKKLLSTGMSVALVASLLSANGMKKEVKGDTPNNNYVKALQESLYFFDANMCGNDVEDKSAFTWRKNCHTGETYAKYNGRTIDLSGGYHDAGDHVKFGLPQAYSATILGLSYLEFGNAYEKYGLTKHYNMIMSRFVDYFERCTVLGSDGEVEAFCYQVGKGQKDHSYWGKPEEQDSKQGDRVNQVYFTSKDNPATDIVSETAAALAIYSINRNDDKALFYAEKLFNYAKNNTKKVATDGPIENGESFYSSGRYADDYCMAAVMLNKATGKSVYADEFKKYSGDCNEWSWLSWDDVSGIALNYGNKAGLYSNPNGNPLLNCFNNMKNGSKVNNGYYSLLNWGSTRYNCNMDAMAFMSKDNSNINWALGQLDIILGDNSRSYVCGHTNYTLYPHHRAASGYSDVNSNGTTKPAHVLVGALVGGPDQDGNFINDASKYQYSEVALDYNAGYVLALSGAVAEMIRTNASDQTTVDDNTLCNEFRSSVVTTYRSESAYGRFQESQESSSEESSSTVEEPSSEEKPSTVEVPSSKEKPSTVEEPSSEEKPSTVEEPSSEETPSKEDIQSNENTNTNTGSNSTVNNKTNVKTKVNTNNNKKDNSVVKGVNRKNKKIKYIKINIKSKKKYKTAKRIKIKSKYKIKKILINNKKVKFNRKKKNVKFKLKKYKKFLKKRKINKIVIKDIKGHVLIKKFKI